MHKHYLICATPTHKHSNICIIYYSSHILSISNFKHLYIAINTCIVETIYSLIHVTLNFPPSFLNASNAVKLLNLRIKKGIDIPSGTFMPLRLIFFNNYIISHLIGLIQSHLVPFSAVIHSDNYVNPLKFSL